MKKPRTKFNAWVFKQIIAPWMLKNKALAAITIKEAIVYQMWAANISFHEINKWLAKMRQPTIKAYTMEKNGPRLFYRTLTSEEKANISTRIVKIV